MLSQSDACKDSSTPSNFGSLLGHRSQKDPKHHTKVQQVLHQITQCFHNFQQVITYHETKISHLITRRSWGIDKTTDAIQQSVNKNYIRVAINSSLSHHHVYNSLHDGSITKAQRLVPVKDTVMSHLCESFVLDYPLDDWMV